MRIAMVDPSLFTIPYDQLLVEGLRETGHDVRWFGRPLRSWEREESCHGQVEEFFYKSLETSALHAAMPKNLRLGMKALGHVMSMMAFAGEMKKWRPDVIHFQWFPVPLVDALFVRSLRRFCPVVATVHDSRPFNANPSSLFQSVAAFKAAKACDHIIVHTKSAIEAMVRVGVDQTRLSRIDHGLLAARADRVSSEKGVVRNRLRLVQFGTVKEYKGVDILIKAVGSLEPGILESLDILVAGKADGLRESLVGLRDSLGLRQVVTLDFRYVPTEEMERLLREADILLFPYRNIEASGVLFASLQYCKPVIASDLGVFRELLVHGVHGWLVPAGDIGALTRAIREAVGAPGILNAMEENMAKLKQSIPSWKAIGDKTVEVYRSSRCAWGARPC